MLALLIIRVLLLAAVSSVDAGDNALWGMIGTQSAMCSDALFRMTW